MFALHCSVKPFAQSPYGVGASNKPSTAVAADMGLLGSSGQAPPPPPWEGRAIATHKLRLVEFSAFMEQQQDPDTVSV
jgi:transcriptional enhancer factor